MIELMIINIENEDTISNPLMKLEDLKFFIDEIERNGFGANGKHYKLKYKRVERIDNEINTLIYSLYMSVSDDAYELRK